MVANMSEPNKCIVVLSGGPDSAVVAYWAKKQGFLVNCLSFKYGQIAEKETAQARLIAEKLGTPIKVIDLSSLREIFIGVTSLCDPNIALTSEFTTPIVVPFRNAIFLSIAVSYAAAICAKQIFYGAHGSDAANYPDCRKEFYESLEKTAKLGTEANIKIKAPFSNIPKSELLKIGVTLGVPFELTWSCYLEKEKHCGKCESCINRKNAFREAKIPDPTQYEEQWKSAETKQYVCVMLAVFRQFFSPSFAGFFPISLVVNARRILFESIYSAMFLKWNKGYGLDSTFIKVYGKGNREILRVDRQFRSHGLWKFKRVYKKQTAVEKEFLAESGKLHTA
jgi:7-cyano-7-deazaguanine synthase